MIEVSVNNDRRTIAEERPLSELLEEWGFRCERIAVAVNDNFVPRSQYGSYALQANDRVDVVAPVQGG